MVNQAINLAIDFNDMDFNKLQFPICSFEDLPKVSPFSINNPCCKHARY